MATISNNKSFLGVGWNYPVEIAAGQVATAQYEEDVRQSVLIVLTTNPGERMKIGRASCRERV